jgi:AcrR family transcriptional regulator
MEKHYHGPPGSDKAGIDGGIVVCYLEYYGNRYGISGFRRARVADNGPQYQTILSRASEQFVRYGYAKTTTGEIAAAAGISKKTLYKFFTSKEKLFRACAQMHLDEIKKNFDRIGADRERSLIDKLWESMAVLARKLREVGDFLKERPRGLGKAYDELLALRREVIVGFYRKLFREGVRKGAINRRVNETAFILMLVTVSQSLFAPEMLANLPISNIDLFSSVAYTLLEGVLSERERQLLDKKPPVAARAGEDFWHA